MSDSTRRDFLRNAAALGISLSAAEAIFAARPARARDADNKSSGKPSTTQAAARPRHGLAPSTTVSGNKDLKVAFVGVGGKGGHNLRLVAECGPTICALCDVDQKRLDEAHEAYPDAKTHTDYRKMLETQKDIDAVVVSTPDHSHAAAVMMALKLGKHVYCEKPLTYNIYEARQLVKAARKAKVATQMGNQGHSSEGSQEQVNWIKAGAIGPVHEVHVWTDRPIWPQGLTRPKESESVPDYLNWDLWLGPAPERPYHSGYHPFSWRGWWDFGTGALGDMACHIMDTPYWALDLKDPTSVEAFSEGGTRDSAPKWSIIRYEFPKRGELPPVKMFWYDGRIIPPATLVERKSLPGEGNGIIFVGEKGTIAAALNGQPKIIEEKLAKEFEAPAKPTTRPINYDHYHHRQWVEAALGKTDKAPMSNFDYAGPLTETVLLGNLAIRTGRRVEWDAEKMKCTNVSEANQYVKRDYRKGWEL